MSPAELRATTLSAAEPGALTARIHDAVERARAAMPPPHIVQVRFAGAIVRLELFGDVVRDAFAWPFVPAPDDAAADLTVAVWDHAHGAAIPVPSGAGRDSDGDQRHVFWEMFWVFGFDERQQRAFFHVADARDLPTWAVAQPLLKVMHPWLRTRGQHVMHAGAVGVAGRGVLIVGPSGSGKSTLSIAASQSGLDYIGDDYVALDVQDLVAHGLYRIAKLAPANLADRLPELARVARAPVDGLDKRLLEVELSAMDRGLRIVAVVIPEVTHAAQSRLVLVSQGRALRALAPSTLLQLPGFASDFKVMADVVRRLPAYHLPLGPDLAGAVAELRRLSEAGP